jgi:hypothetical protein
MKTDKKGMTFLEAARAVLEEMKQPMHFKKITEVAIQKNYLKSKGKTPEWTMGARLSVDVKEKGLNSEFIRTDNGKYGLARWRRSGKGIDLPVGSFDPDKQRFWLVCVEPENFSHDLKKNSFDTVGVKYRMRNTLGSIKPDDKIVIYVKKHAVFTAVLIATSESFIDDSKRWPVLGKELKARISVTPESVLNLDEGIDARQLYSVMDVFTQYPEKHRTLALRNGITEIKESDFMKVAEYFV